MREEIKYSEELDVRNLLKETSPPYIYAIDKNCPVYHLGYFTWGAHEKWIWIDEELNKADDLTLWKVYALIQQNWGAMYKSISEKCEKKLDALGIEWYRD